jgi:hypothetical protein
MQLDIVTHCWRFSRALTYQLSSLVLHPPERTHVNLHLVYSPEDAPTMRVLQFFRERLYHSTGFAQIQRFPTVRMSPWPAPVPELVNRTIDRNLRALATTADAIWMTDADYVFGEGCLDALADIEWSDMTLCYPRQSWISSTHAVGETYSRSVAAGPAVLDVNAEDFIAKRDRKAIGGTQIIAGHAARQHGYCNVEPSLLRAYQDGKWRYCTRGDTIVRKILGTSGTPIDVPNLFRIRQETGNVCDMAEGT